MSKGPVPRWSPADSKCACAQVWCMPIWVCLSCAKARTVSVRTEGPRRLSGAKIALGLFVISPSLQIGREGHRRQEGGEHRGLVVKTGLREEAGLRPSLPLRTLVPCLASPRSRSRGQRCLQAYKLQPQDRRGQSPRSQESFPSSQAHSVSGMRHWLGWDGVSRAMGSVPPAEQRGGG